MYTKLQLGAVLVSESCRVKVVRIQREGEEGEGKGREGVRKEMKERNRAERGKGRGGLETREGKEERKRRTFH